MKTVPREKIEKVIVAFNKTKEEQFSLVGDTDAFVSQVLKRALGAKKRTCCSIASCKDATFPASKR